MNKRTFVWIVISFFSIQYITACKEYSHPEFLQQQIHVVNEGLAELIEEKVTKIAVIASKSSKIQPINDDLRFYYKNTRLMIEEPASTQDSIRFWRLTKSRESMRYGYKSNLDSNLIFGEDTLIRKTALLNNMYHYLEHIHQSFSYCRIMFGSIPVIDSSKGDVIYFYGKPHTYSELDLMIKHSEYLSNIPDSLPLWGKLQILDSTMMPRLPINQSTN